MHMNHVQDSLSRSVNFLEDQSSRLIPTHFLLSLSFSDRYLEQPSYACVLCLQQRLYENYAYRSKAHDTGILPTGEDTPLQMLPSRGPRGLCAFEPCGGTGSASTLLLPRLQSNESLRRGSVTVPLMFFGP